MEIEGGEYLICSAAFAKHRQAVLDLKVACADDPATGIDHPPAGVVTIDARAKETVLGTRYLFIPFSGKDEPTMFVMCRRGTHEQLGWLERINNESGARAVDLQSHV